eukprot:gnl/TRDRNA2_/TRDRNA2_166515_c0_seq2.p1 gnl/TRDRNA2_/TRDRNA2_166515_c0~~gnl/TRDRNA2_/TRDRNA2_166515_c0_seq2.p1  ORF type:complete len:684 (+),score=115.94 gnl/TRDRNA2_/TRDRNA2_166515_c0_seq2:197-2053(+)
MPLVGSSRPGPLGFSGILPRAALPTFQAAASAGADQDPFAGFVRAVVGILASLGPGTPLMMSKVASAAPVQVEWNLLKGARIIGNATKMKQVLLERPHLFKLFNDARGQANVMLVHVGGVTALPGTASFATGSGFSPEPAPAAGGANAAMQAAAAAIAAAGNKGMPMSDGSTLPSAGAVLPVGLVAGTGKSQSLTAEQVSAIEAHLRTIGGKDRVSRIGSLFGVKKVQLATHFNLVPCGDDPLVVPGRKMPPSTQGTNGTSQMIPGTNVVVGNVVDVLDQLLLRLIPSRSSVGEVMVFCMQQAARDHAAKLARRLVASLSESGLSTDNVLARFYVINDLLHNATCRRKGASQFGQSFQELLPEACEQTGRVWLRRLEGHLSRIRGEAKIRRVLAAWDDWSVFPPLFTKGLEALLFSPVLETTAEDAEKEADPTLRKKLLRWFEASDQARLPYACRLRGLSGKFLSTAACRARLCHFERYWHRPGLEIVEPNEDAFSGSGGSRSSWESGVDVSRERPPNALKPPKQLPSAHAGDDNDALDGEPLNEEDLLALKALEEEEAEAELAHNLSGPLLGGDPDAWAQMQSMDAKDLSASDMFFVGDLQASAAEPPSKRVRVEVD